MSTATGTTLNLPLTLKLNEKYLKSQYTRTTSGQKISINSTRFASDYTWLLPPDNANGVLTNNGLGQLSWTNPDLTQINVSSIILNNTDTTGFIRMWQQGPGACCINFRTPGGQFAMGIDQADNNTFKISKATNIGTNDVFSIGNNGSLNLGANMTLPETQQNASAGIFRIGQCNLYALNATNNMFIGKNTGTLTFSTAANNLATGTAALQLLTTGLRNVVYGPNAVTLASSTQDICAFGFNAVNSALSTSRLCAFGNYALLANVTGIRNAAFGHQALTSLYSANDCTAIGDAAGLSLTTGSQCTFLGSATNTPGGAATNSTLIGYGATTNSNNRIQMGNTNVASFGFADVILTRNQLGQLSNLQDVPSVLISPTAWNTISAMDQTVGTTSNVTFQNVTVNGTLNAAAVSGRMLRSISTVVVSQTLATSQDIVNANASSGSIVLTLPLTSALPGNTYTITKTDATANTVTIVTSGADTIQGLTSMVLRNRYDVLNLLNIGVVWISI